MNPQDELSDIIDHYLNNGMSQKERFAFEEKLAQDEILAAKVNAVRITNEAIYYASLAELKNTIGKDIKNITYKPSFNWKKASYISIASLVLVSGITTYLVTNSTKTDRRKADTANTAKEMKQDSVQRNNTTITQGKATDEKKSYQEHILENPAAKDSIQTGNTGRQKSILLTDNNQTTIDKIKPTDADNKIHTTSTEDLTIKKTVTPAVTDNNISCTKSFKIHTEASCKQKETGSITIASDGAYLYTFQVDIKTTSGSNAAFPNMASGVYQVLITYGKECTYTQKVTIDEKWCGMNDSYSFNPDYNEKWVLHYETGASGTFTIFDTSGRDIYSNTFGSGNAEWNGNDRQDAIVPVGVYIAFINYSDGRKEKVALTIVR